MRTLALASDDREVRLLGFRVILAALVWFFLPGSGRGDWARRGEVPAMERLGMSDATVRRGCIPGPGDDALFKGAVGVRALGPGDDALFAAAAMFDPKEVGRAIPPVGALLPPPGPNDLGLPPTLGGCEGANDDLVVLIGTWDVRGADGVGVWALADDVVVFVVVFVCDVAD